MFGESGSAYASLAKKSFISFLYTAGSFDAPRLYSTVFASIWNVAVGAACPPSTPAWMVTASASTAVIFPVTAAAPSWGSEYDGFGVTAGNCGCACTCTDGAFCAELPDCGARCAVTAHAKITAAKKS